MKHLLTTLALLALAAAGAGYATYRLSCDPQLEAATARGDALEWLRVDFKLTGDQFEEIRALHEAYDSVCQIHCAAIQEAARERAAVVGDSDASPEARAAAEARVQELRRECETAIARHVRDVAALMSPEQGQRYLALVLPKIADFDHQAAPDLGLSHSH